MGWPVFQNMMPFMNTYDLDRLPDVRDGLARKERVVLYCINQLQKERGGRNVPTAMLYGRVLEYMDMSEQELQLILERFSS
jgi:hypothetical protein